MGDFIDRLAVFIIVSALFLSAVTVLSVVALANGYWVFPLLIWGVLPAYIVIRTYLKDRSND